MEIFTYDNGGPDNAAVGMRTPSGEYERPIGGTRLFWIYSGKIVVFVL